MAQVKTYRALRELRVSGKVRQFGELVPEAAKWPSLRSYLRAEYIEAIYVDQSVIDEFNKKLGQGSATSEPKKKQAKKSTAKTKKRTVKKKVKGNADESKGNLSEQAV